MQHKNSTMNYRAKEQAQAVAKFVFLTIHMRHKKVNGPAFYTGLSLILTIKPVNSILSH